MIVTTLAPTASDATELLEACIALLESAGQIDAVVTLDVLHMDTIDALCARQGVVAMSSARECIEDALGAVSEYAQSIGAALTVSAGEYVLIDATA